MRESSKINSRGSVDTQAFQKIQSELGEVEKKRQPYYEKFLKISTLKKQKFTYILSLAKKIKFPAPQQKAISKAQELDRNCRSQLYAIENTNTSFVNSVRH